jgi:hypothetical protein
MILICRKTGLFALILFLYACGTTCRLNIRSQSDLYRINEELKHNKKARIAIDGIGLDVEELELGPQETHFTIYNKQYTVPIHRLQQIRITKRPAQNSLVLPLGIAGCVAGVILGDVLHRLYDERTPGYSGDGSEYEKTARMVGGFVGFLSGVVAANQIEQRGIDRRYILNPDSLSRMQKD